MENSKQSLDDISGPSRTEQTGDCGSSVPNPPKISTAPFTVGADSQSSSDETESASSARDSHKGRSHVTEEEDLELQRAIEEMKHLDEILSKMICREKEIKRQRKEFQARLWQDFLQNKPEDHSECTSEAVNTRLFLALETLAEDEENFVTVFTTQVSESEQSRDQTPEQSEKNKNSCGSFEADREEPGEEQFGSSHRGSSKSKKRQKDFVNRNIELVSYRRDTAFLSRLEKERLAKLLQEIDGEEEAASRGADSEGDVWAECVLTGWGYNPQPSDLEQLIHIDSKIHLLLPVRDVLSVRDPPTGLGSAQDSGAEAGSSSDGDLQPGEKVLQDIMEWKGLERRLQEIQQQLETLSWSQELTSEWPDLTEEQLRGLLAECEQSDCWIQDLEADETP